MHVRDYFAVRNAFDTIHGIVCLEHFNYNASTLIAKTHKEAVEKKKLSQTKDNGSSKAQFCRKHVALDRQSQTFLTKFVK